jgi:glycosyltransferase involved in cell wall biosynthesis
MPQIQNIDKSPRVAILSPFHNRAASVERTFRSISEQTFDDFEALIWDDASTDGTWEEMQRVAAELDDKRFKIYRYDSNIGLTKGLNEAISKTNAEYIAIVGSGDTCHPERIKRQLTSLDGEESAVFCATASTTTDPISKKIFTDENFDKKTIELKDISEICPFTHGSVMYRSSSLKKVGGYEPVFKWCADWDMFFRLLAIGNANYLDEVLYYRVAQADGVSFSPKKALEQSTCKQLALKLSTCTTSQRAEVIKKAQEHGIQSAISDRMNYVNVDIARRNTKLYLMGTRSAGDELNKLSKINNIRYPLKYKISIIVARIISFTSLDSGAIISLARKLPK